MHERGLQEWIFIHSNARLTSAAINNAALSAVHYNQSTTQYRLIVQEPTEQQICRVVEKKSTNMKLLATLMLGLIVVNSLRGQEVTYLSSKQNNRTVYKTSSGVTSFEVEVRGKIELTDDDRDIKSMSPDAYLEIKKTVFGSKRTLIIAPANEGLKREYYEGRSKVAFEPEGRKWMNEVLPELVRNTTIGADSRINRFFRQGGTTAVLNEIKVIESDHVRQHYANRLMALSNVPAKDYTLIIQTLAGLMDSDYYLSEFLKYNARKLLSTKESADALLAATLEIDSDHYKTEVIKEALRLQQPTADGVKAILASVGKIESDHYKAEVLTTLLRQPSGWDAVMTEIIQATKAIDSDHYKTTVLRKALAKKNLPAAAYQQTLESIKLIESDHYKTEVLKDLLNQPMPADQILNLVNISTAIESNHYLTIVYTTALKNQELSEEAFKILINRASKVESDHYSSVILKEALGLPQLTDQKVESILAATVNLESDHYITDVLTTAAPIVRTGSANVKDAYRKAARNISSETYYGRALKAVD